MNIFWVRSRTRRRRRRRREGGQAMGIIISVLQIFQSTKYGCLIYIKLMIIINIGINYKILP